MTLSATNARCALGSGGRRLQSGRHYNYAFRQTQPDHFREFTGRFPQRSSSRPSTTRWGRPTKGLISNYRAHVVSPKAYHDLTNDSRWTPFVGVGASLTRADLRNSRRLLHNTLLQRCQQMELSSNVANRHYSLVESNWTNRLRRRPIRPLDRFLVCQPYCRPLWPSLQV